VRNEILNTIKKARNILHTIQRNKSNWIGHILPRNFLLKHGTEEKIRDGKRRKKT